MKRELTEQEETQMRKLNDLNKETVKVLQFEVDHMELMINTGLECNLIKKQKELKKQLIDHKNSLEIYKQNIKVTSDQLENGVETND